MIARLLIGLLARRPVGLDIGGSADPYMRRRYVIPRNRLFNIYCHEIRRDDDDRALHDHPWPNLSVVLSGGYREIVFVRPPRFGAPLPATIERQRRRGAVVARRAKTAHRLALHRDGDGRPIPAWTLFVTVLRGWGVLVPARALGPLARLYRRREGRSRWRGMRRMTAPVPTRSDIVRRLRELRDATAGRRVTIGDLAGVMFNARMPARSSSSMRPRPASGLRAGKRRRPPAPAGGAS